MKSFWRSARLITCRAAILVIGYTGAPVSLPAYGQEKTAADQRTNESVNRVRQAAEQGDANAQARLGDIYYQGQGVPQDYAEAARWLRQAADQGDVRAQFGLGILYYKGQGVQQDYAEAARWYRKAADQGQADAQCYLGSLYAVGQGVTQDYAEAVRWYRKAADQGQIDAQKTLGLMYERGLGVLPDRAEAALWYRKAAGQTGQSFLSDDAIQKAIDSGRATKAQALWKSIEKNHAVRINRQSFADSVGKTAIFLADRDLIALAAADAARRHRVLSVDEVKQWPDFGATHVLLVAVAGGMYIANLPKWQAPAVHMTITVDGREIQPLSESATERSETTLFPSQTGVVSRSGNVVTYTRLYESALYDVAHSRTWFSFDIPPDGARLTVTVISADGHEKHKDFDASMLK
jgi:hypothetical protein